MVFLGPDTVLFLFSVMDSSAMLFLSVYTIITLSDMDCDYLNASECSMKLNKWVIPELLSSAALTVLLLVTGYWCMFAINLSMTVWLSYRLYSVPQGNIGVYDAIELHSRWNLKTHMKECVARTFFYLISVFIYLYCMIITIMSHNR